MLKTLQARLQKYMNCELPDVQTGFRKGIGTRDQTASIRWIINKAEAAIFLERSRFFDDPTDVDNLISGSSAFSKSSLNIWKFTVHVLLKPDLDIFSITLLACEMSATVQLVEHSLTLPFLGIGMKTDLFQSCGHCWVLQVCWHIECSTFTVSSFRIWNNSTRSPSPPLALFVVMLPKAYLTLHSRMLALGEWSHHHGCLGHDNLFCIVLLYIAATSS